MLALAGVCIDVSNGNEVKTASAHVHSRGMFDLSLPRGSTRGGIEAGYPLVES